MKKHRWLLGVGTLCLIVVGGLLIYGRPLPPPDRVAPTIAHTQPTQVALLSAEPITATHSGYRYVFTPHATYSLSGLVVSLHHSNSIIDTSHGTDPAQTVDLCVVWGPDITTDGYRQVTYSHGDFTCFYNWTSDFDPPFSPEFLSNNHLVPTTPELAKLIASVNVGDQIKLSGLLVDYDIYQENGTKVEWRHTSLTRKDTGNGACEIIYLTEAHILARSMPWREPLIWTLLLLASLTYGASLYFAVSKKITFDPSTTPDRADPRNPLDPRNFM